MDFEISFLNIVFAVAHQSNILIINRAIDKPYNAMKNIPYDVIKKGKSNQRSFFEHLKLMCFKIKI